jgi:DNA-binding FrmR family transcriptional regulator
MTSATPEVMSRAISTRAARLAIIAIVSYQILLIALIFLRPDLAPSWHTISEWAIGRYGWIMSGERALEGEQECTSILQFMAACRGALNGLMAEVMEGHIRFHVLDPKSGKNAPQVEAAEELIEIVRTYLK